jgi:large subunit ribosomal protein L22
MAMRSTEADGTRAVLRHCRTSAFKVRPVLDLIRGQSVSRAREVLRFSERDAAGVVDKVLGSAVSNAENNDGLDADELYVSACYADEGTTLRRWRPRARGRATRIRKRSCHITVIVSRMPEERLARVRASQAGDAGRRARRVAGGRQGRRRGQRREGPVTADVVQEKDAAQEAAMSDQSEGGASEAPDAHGEEGATENR